MATPSYPSSIVNFGVDHVDGEIVYAAHPNALQAEVVAIETALGVNPASPYATVSARLAAIEATVRGSGGLSPFLNMGA